jgi:hypothetical protein
MKKIKIKRKSLDKLRHVGDDVKTAQIDWNRAKFSAGPVLTKYNPSYSITEKTLTEKHFNSKTVESIKADRHIGHGGVNHYEN